MTKKRENLVFNEFTGLPIRKLIANPFVAAARAQNMMARQEVQSLLDSCFFYENGIYYPIMLEMSLQRAFVEAPKKLQGEPTLNEVSTVFSVPLITLFPITSLGIDSIDVEFDFEVSAQYETNTEVDLTKEDAKSALGKKNNLADIPFVELLGNVKQQSIGKTKTSDPKEVQIIKSGGYHVDVHANALPLPNGLTILLNVFSKAIQPTEIEINDESK